MNFSEFLKKFSPIDNKFIDDFNEICSIDVDNDNSFLIDLKLVSKWLKANDHKLKKTLVKSYKLNIDYKIEKYNYKTKINEEKITLTTDCFKRLCMKSRTARGNEVSTYYIQMEKMLKKYYKYINEAYKDTIDMLENNQKEPPKNIKKCVYVLKSTKDPENTYRLGMTSQFEKRLQTHNSSNNDKLKVVYVYETTDAEKVEKCVINLIQEKRYIKNKDFYKIDINLLKNVISDCGCLIGKYSKNEVEEMIGGRKKENSKKTSKTKKEFKTQLYLFIEK